jgi:hypothetical protein
LCAIEELKLMAEEDKKDEKKKGLDLPLDRYEIVGIAVPGAGLVAVLVWFCKIDGFPDLTKTTLGSLGLFTIAAFVAGHVVQSIANTAEDLYKRFRRLPELISPSEYVPLQRADVEKGRTVVLRWRRRRGSNPRPPPVTRRRSNETAQ